MEVIMIEKIRHRNSVRPLLFLAVILALSMLPGSAFGQYLVDDSALRVELSTDDPAVRRVMDIQDRYNTTLMAMPGVHAVGTGYSDEGTLAILVFAEATAPLPDLPAELEGVPVSRKAMGVVTPAIANDEELPVTGSTRESFSSWGGAGGASTMTVRPSFIGQSTSNWNECGAGTIGARVRNANNFFVISCNHVFARLNAAALGEKIVQPGRADVGCAQNLADTIGSLADYQPLTYGSWTPNTMDAALVRINPAFVYPGTPYGGYGAPSTTTIAPALSMSVQKYGKTTALTTGTVAAVNVTVAVNYAGGTAYFAGQFIVNASNFCNGGDSGSLVVTNNNNKNPVGMLFGRSGTSYTFVTPISVILARFNVEIDDGVVVPLPVELTSFSGRTRNDDVELRWQTATELNNVGFAVQRSRDKAEWSDISFVQGAGESYSPRSYDYVDQDILRTPSLAWFYRLMQIDRDGTSSFSATLEIAARPVALDMQVFPNPVRDVATVRMHSDAMERGTLSLYDVHGRRYDHLTREMDIPSGSHIVNLPMSELASGRYFLEFRTPAGSTRTMIVLHH